MAECSFTIKKEINGVTHELPLNRDEISAIWSYYDDVLAVELIIDKLINDFGVKNISAYKNVIDDLLHRFKKNRSYGCDEDYSMEFAFEEMKEKINSLSLA